MKLLRPILASATRGALFLGSSSLVSGAATAASGGPVYFIITPAANGQVSKILITGAIGDYGTIRTVGTKASSLQRVSLKKGSFIVDEYVLQVASQDHQPTINPFNCSFRVESGIRERSRSAKAPVSTNISRARSVATDTFAAIQPMKNGKCVDNGRFVAQLELTIGSGPVSFNGS